VVKIYKDVLEKRVDPAIDELQKLRKPYHKRKSLGIIKTLVVSALVAYSSYSLGTDIFCNRLSPDYAVESSQQKQEKIMEQGKQNEKQEMYANAVADSVEDRLFSEGAEPEYTTLKTKAPPQRKNIGKPRFPERFYKVNRVVMHTPAVNYNQGAMDNLEFIVDEGNISVDLGSIDIRGKTDKGQRNNWLKCMPANHSDLVLRIIMLDKSDIILYSDKRGITDPIDTKYLKIENRKIGFDDSVLALYVTYLGANNNDIKPSLHVIAKKYL